MSTGSSRRSGTIASARPRFGRTGPTFLAALVGIALSITAFWVSRGQDTERVRGLLNLRADWRSSVVAQGVEQSVLPLIAAAAAAAGDPIGQADFDRVARQMRRETSFPARSVIWVPRVPRGSVDEFLRMARAARGATYRLLDRAPGFATVPAAERPEYFPVLFEVAFEEQPSVAGVTFESEPVRRAALERARDSGQPAATAPVQLVNLGDEPALIVFWPVYRRGQPTDNVEARRAALLGFAVGVYRIQPLLTETLRDTPPVRSTISFFVGKASTRPVARYLPAAGSIVTKDAEAPRASEFHFERSREILGQSWRMAFDYGPDVVGELRSTVPYGRFVAGLLLTGIVAFVIYAQGTRRRAVEALVADRTAALDRSNEELRREADQRKRGDSRIRETSQMLQAVFDEAPFAIVSLSPELDVLLWNRAAESMFGYTAEEIVGKKYPLVPADHRAEFEQLMARTMSGERLRGVSVRRQRKDGQLRDIVFYGAPLFGPDGTLQAMLFVLDDVTERRLVERQLAQAQRMEAVGQLTGGLAHDFNNILGVVVGNLDLALDDLPAGAGTRKLVDAALGSALRGADLVRSLLAFSRRQPLAPRPIDLNERLPEIGSVLRRTLGENIQVVTSPGRDLWPALADPAQLETAVLNLAVNARDAMPEGGTLTIETANIRLDEDYAAMNAEVVPGDYVMIAVSDTGTGMPPEVLERVFEPFYTTKGVGKGTGLGLAMVHGFAKQSNGHIKIYSEVGQGTTVRLFLPRADAPPKEKEEIAARAEPVPTGSEIVLAVEDNPGLRSAAASLLGDLGYRVLTAENGPEALRLIAGGAPFDLLFTDIVMPGGMSGYDLAAEAAKLRPGLKVLFTTGFADAVATKAKSRPPDAAVLTKPYRKAELARAIRRALDGTKESAPP